MTYWALVAGAGVAVLVVIQFRRAGLEQSNWAYPALLATFPAYYWAFAIYAADYAALANEIAVGAGFLCIAAVACRLDSVAGLRLLALGYIGHAAYDAFHGLLFVNRGAPSWWPGFCGAVDALIGLYLAYCAASMRPKRARGA